MLLSLDSGLQLMTNSYFEWVENLKHPDYLFCKDMILGPVMTLFLFHIGIRTNCPDIVLCSRLQFNNIFYGKCHLKYQRRGLYEMMVQSLPLSPEVISILEWNRSNGVHGKMEVGGRFCIRGGGGYKTAKKWGASSCTDRGTVAKNMWKSR